MSEGGQADCSSNGVHAFPTELLRFASLRLRDCGLLLMFLGVAPVVLSALRVVVLGLFVLAASHLSFLFGGRYLLGRFGRFDLSFVVLVVSFFGRLSAVLPSFLLLAVFFGFSDGWSGLSFLATLALGLPLVVRTK